ncbi:unconventional myosin-IXb isoform X2 [Periophthalmus magnuspinnatus]|uniref:unconventional myosin-IXb isoform X2 n=1 Tax=Periophthalmus magnuspinnatus TaxID=409849 RepID=UPI00145A12B9|nr:unconventional myosin-IXb isoform X2 [Periophthalmus magnuspinnatus]XP_055084297.1 unconventional myosin-IXb isoform X2 [Periophthalmus magnuspinnatus]
MWYRMSALSRPGSLDHCPSEARVVQIYPQPAQDTTTYCPLQITHGDTARAVIKNAVLMLGLDSNQSYKLVEVKKTDEEEKQLDCDDFPLDLVLLWPPKTQKWHPKTDGYYFILKEVPNGKSSSEEYDDLCNLTDITEDSITQTLRERFYKLKIYTYTGNILIAINPNKCLPVYYNPKYVKMYENQPLGKLSPHIFAIAAAAYRNMLNSQTNQCIVISGESGSGKTESCSFLVHCLTALSQQTYSSGLERIILGAAPVLEAFGNAKTVENNNSSRFGKFIQLNYLESGVIRGAVIEKYLLEKCRLVFRNKNERNYHVFYYLLVGASKDEQKEFHLLRPQDYHYVRQGDLQLDDEESLGQEYKRLHQAMEMVGFLPSTKKQIFSILSVILHLGNLTYSRDTRGLKVGPDDVLETLSELLKVKKEVLLKALTTRRTVATNAIVLSKYTVEEAAKMRDSMAKSLYSALFDWIIFHINHALFNRRDMEESVACLTIGVLDMFGFEDLQKNSFEQLCINYTNEKLQYYINHHIFTLEQEDYASEGLVWQTIDFTDNIDCINLMSGKPTGLFELLNTEISLPDASDKNLLKKMMQHHQDSPFFETNSDSIFTIQHFAGSVTYNIKDFVEKNCEHMRPEVVSLLRSSERAFLHHLVCSSHQALFRWGVVRATIRIISVFKHLARRRAELLAAKRPSCKSLKELKRNSARLSSNSWTLDFSFDRSDEQPLDVFEDIFANYEKRTKNKGGRQKQLIPKNLMDLRSLQHIVGVTVHDKTGKATPHLDGLIAPPTVCTQFQASLQKLLERIEKSQQFFIVCLRSNNEKKEMHFDSELIKRQVHNTGLVQMVLMQKAGYTAKYTFKDFVEKFRMLLPKGATPTPKHISQLLEKMKLNKSTYQLGKTKLFLKENERQFLRDAQNTVVMHHIVVLQRWFRSCLIRIHFLQKRDATLIIQKCWREFYEKQNRAATVIQTAWRTSLKSPKSEHDQRGRTRTGRDSLSKKELKRQAQIEVSPNRMPQSGSGGSTPPLHRPLSLPSDTTAYTEDSPTKSSLQRYKDVGAIKEKADRWRERLSEGEPTDDSSPERHRRARRRDEYHNKGKSMSADELSIQSSSDSSPSAGEKIPSETDGSRYSLPPRNSEDEGNQTLTTPERVWFLSRFLKKRTPKYISSHVSTHDKSVTLPRYSPHPYHMPNQQSSRAQRNPTIHISRATRALEWNASLDRDITDPKELRNLDEYLGNQVNELKSRVKELSPTETIFLTATMEFRETIKSMFSVQKPQIAYKDLMKGYQNKVNSLAGPKQKAEVSLVVNLFQSVLDIFVRGLKRTESEPVKPNKQTKKRRKKEKCPDSPLDHLFSTYQVNIMQSCDLCGSYIWGMEKAYMCSACKLICHKKCLSKIITDCSTRCSRMDDHVPGSLHFGVQVCVLTSKANPVPKVVELLLMHVELNGLYTEGIYRKSGSACRARELHQILETNPEAACLDNYPIHTISGLVKRWLRELPDPLMTFALYNDFLHAVELPERSERIRAVYQKVDELPPSNYNTLERLIFHLVRVAKEEDHNKMSPNSLAIVFAPCVLRSPDSDDPFLGMKDVAKITMCVEILITEQFRRYKEMMQNIQELEYAEALAVKELHLRRQNTVVEKTPDLEIPEHTDSDETEKTLIDRIKSIKQEKVDLACRLPDLEQEHSDNDNLDSSSSMSTESLEDRLKSLDSEGKLTLRLSNRKPESPTNPTDLAQRVRSLRAQTDDEPFEFLPGDPLHSPTTKDKSSTIEKQGSFDDLDIPYIDADEDQT